VLAEAFGESVRRQIGAQNPVRLFALDEVVTESR
jgi:hypothetical protein